MEYNIFIVVGVIAIIMCSISDADEMQIELSPGFQMEIWFD